MDFEVENKEDSKYVKISGHVDSNSVVELESKFYDQFDKLNDPNYIIDLENLDYISSAGLRFFLKIKKDGCKFTLINLSSAVYETFDITGFTKIMDVERAHRSVNVDGCKILGKGANGIVYRLDQERILKLYTKPDCMDDIVDERKHSEYALLIGIPTAISFDIVKVGDKFGTIFELIDANSMAVILQEDEEHFDENISKYVSLLKEVHAIEYDENGELCLPDAMQKASRRIDYIKDYISQESYDDLQNLLRNLPSGNKILHGDCQPNNVMVTKDGPLFIDMDTLVVGDPIYELAALYSSLQAFGMVLKNDNLLEMDRAIMKRVWDSIFNEYYSDLSSKEKEQRLEICKVLAFVQVYRNMIKYSALRGEECVKCAKEYLLKAIDSWKEICNG